MLLLALCGISLAPRAQIWIYMYIIFLVRCRSHFMCEYRLPIGKYRAALRHTDCAEGANIDLHIVPSSTADATAVPLPHKACRQAACGGRLVLRWLPTRRRSPAPRRSRPLFVTPKACHLSRYRESLPHKARQSRAGEGR